MDGYAKLATLMGAYPEVAIIRRFSALNVQSLLYLQAELVLLETRLREYEKEDRDSGDPNRIDFAVDFMKLSSTTIKSTDDGVVMDGKETVLKDRRWTLMMDIKNKLREYSKQTFIKQDKLTIAEHKTC